jgi:hypothetical protein
LHKHLHRHKHKHSHNHNHNHMHKQTHEHIHRSLLILTHNAATSIAISCTHLNKRPLIAEPEWNELES